MLENSLFGDDQPDICFIIRDQKKKADQIVDETVMEFEAKLKAAGVTGITAIIPLTKLKKDFGPNNMKLKLLNTYDLFLVESEIAEHVYTILGKHFIKKRKRPHQIDTDKTELMSTTIELAKRKVSFKISSNSNFSIFEVGTHKMDNAKIVANIADATEQLKEKWPGGWKNILRLYLKPMGPSKVSIPIYYSKVNPNDVEVPVEVGVKQTRLDKLTEQLAKKSKRLRVDRKTKRIVKVTDGAVGAGKKADKQKKIKKDKKIKPEAGTVKVEDAASADVQQADVKKSKKDKKRKLLEKVEEEAEAAPADGQKKSKKEKKRKVQDDAVTTSSDPKASNVSSTPPKKAKKSKK